MTHFPVTVRPGAAHGVADVLVLTPADVVPEGPHAEELAAGTGVLVTGTGPWHPSLLALVAGAGIGVSLVAPRPGPLHPDRAGLAAGTSEDLLARVVEPSGTAGAVLGLDGAAPLLRTGDGSVVAAVGTTPEGRRVAVVAAELADPRELERNLVAWLAPRPTAEENRPGPDPLLADPDWQEIAGAIAELQPLQGSDGAVEAADAVRAAGLVRRVAAAVRRLAPRFPHDARYLDAVVVDLERWADAGVGVPDFLDSLVAFAPASQRVDGLRHLVVFPMVTQNGSPDRHLEAVVVEVLWPDFVRELEATSYSNRLFVPIRFVAFTAGYDTNSAVLFPETVAMRAVPEFTWGAIFADREAARFRRVVEAAVRTTGLAVPPDAARLLADQALAEETFVLWDLIHDRTHMRGDLPFDPFMIKQRMPYFLYSLEELRCDLTAFREAVELERLGEPHGRLVQYAVLFDRIFRFPVTGNRVRNYDGLGGQLLFAWLHQRGVLHWTDNRLRIDWEGVPGAVLALAEQVEDLYWRSIDRPKIAHWLAAYALVSGVLTPHPASIWAQGPQALPLTGPLKGLTDAVLPDEFPLSMFYEALDRRISDVVASTRGITA